MKLALTLTFALLAGPALAQSTNPVDQGKPNVPEFTPAFPEQTLAPAMTGPVPEITRFADGLEHPWGIAALPSGGVLVTERPGRLRHVAPDGTLSEPIDGVPEVWAEGQGGLLDVTIGPDFATDHNLTAKQLPTTEK